MDVEHEVVDFEWPVANDDSVGEASGIEEISMPVDWSSGHTVGSGSIVPTPATRVGQSLIPSCDNILKPRVGLNFGTLEDGVDFYKKYALVCGFSMRLSTQKGPKGDIQLKYITCSNAGFSPKNTKTVNSSVKRRRTTTSRTGCPAMVCFKRHQWHGYTIYKFIEGHNHTFYEDRGSEFLRGNRQMTADHKRFALGCQRMSLGPTAAHKLCSAMVGNTTAVGATIVDFKNFHRDFRAFVDEKDVQIVLDKFKRKFDANMDFFFESDNDDEGRLTRLFWADGLSRRNYTCYGDVFSLDATYGTNRYALVFCPFTGLDNNGKCVTFGAGLISHEDASSYAWLLKAFLRAMNNKEPVYIVTDQDLGLKKAVEDVLVNTRHRLCMWHIMQKLTKNVSHKSVQDTDFFTRFHALVWATDMTTSSFEDGWNTLLLEYGLEDNKWLDTMYTMRESWIPAYYKTTPMGLLIKTTSISESQNSTYGWSMNKTYNLVQLMWSFDDVLSKQWNEHVRLAVEYSTAAKPTNFRYDFEDHACDLYTRRAFYTVQADIHEGLSQCGTKNIVEADDHTAAVVTEKNYTEFTVTVDTSTKNGSCSCMRFEGYGLICPHIFFCLHLCSVRKIPLSMMNERWCREPSDMGRLPGVPNKSTSVGVLKIQLWGTVQGIMSNPDVTEDSLVRMIAGLKLDTTPSVVEEHTTMEAVTGINLPPVVKVKLPALCKNKGPQKRMVGELERASTKKSTKSKRICAYCKTEGWHDNRNCPIRADDIASGKLPSSSNTKNGRGSSLRIRDI